MTLLFFGLRVVSCKKLEIFGILEIEPAISLFPVKFNLKIEIRETIWHKNDRLKKGIASSSTYFKIS